MNSEGTFQYADEFRVNTSDAERVVPILLEVIEAPSSIVDLGGGIGPWCKAFKDHGVARVRCIDDPHIACQDLLVDEDEFVPCNLAETFPEPMAVDLALCLEVGEHLQESRSEHLVDFLTSSADLVLFSAAIPGQPDHRHINEKPPLFWKELFGRRGYQQLDIVRPRIIADQAVSYWYRQNLHLYANEKGLLRVKERSARYETIPEDFELVHGSVLEGYRAPRPPAKLSDALGIAWLALKRSLAFRFGGAARGGQGTRARDTE